MTNFLTQQLHDGSVVTIPQGIRLVENANTHLPVKRRHVLIALAWDDHYIQRVPEPYRAFFRYVLPHLRARTTDVHTATSAGFVPELLAGWGRPVNQPVLYAALLLHDSGWSRVSEVDIADSLDGRGLRHGDERMGMVEPHDEFGAQIVREVLPDSPLGSRLSAAEQVFVADLVGHHTWGEYYRRHGEEVPEMVILCDADRLWSYTFENFWQDTVRKRVDAVVYLAEIQAAIPHYLLTQTAQKIARRLCQERQAEVAACQLVTA